MSYSCLTQHFISRECIQLITPFLSS
ncbi:DUF3924 domain-containing protein [Candidatus Aerophobetes bacterium]|uniref:DUF3924 domain-containing protein n=1 Tax=Aerophobetes bacterium TaxID=2030807 RepID=A0A523W0T8_UNCAE|nr:MAG: DUF3924 domain-containing protein [Candidatus Aerophobetes bacterium]